MNILSLIWYVLCPILIITTAGYLLGNKFHVDPHTYNQVMNKVVWPVYIFYGFYLSLPSLSILVFFPFIFLLLLLPMIFGKNQWNYIHSIFEEGAFVTIVILLFICIRDPYVTNDNTSYLPIFRTVSISLVIMIQLSALILHTFKKHQKPTHFLKNLLTLPALYAICAAFACCRLSYPIEETFTAPVISHLSGVFIILATVTFGVQLNYMSDTEKITQPLHFLIPLILAPIATAVFLCFIPILSPLTKQISLIFFTTPCMLYILKSTAIHFIRKKSLYPLLIPACFAVILWITITLSVVLLYPLEA